MSMDGMDMYIHGYGCIYLGHHDDLEYNKLLLDKIHSSKTYSNIHIYSLNR